MYKSTVVRDRAIRPDEYVVCDGLAKDLDLEHIRDDLLRLTVDIRMYECDVVVRGDDVAQGGEALLDPLDLDGVW
jgi:hypothetical protein